MPLIAIPSPLFSPLRHSTALVSTMAIERASQDSARRVEHKRVLITPPAILRLPAVVQPSGLGNTPQLTWLTPPSPRLERVP